MSSASYVACPHCQAKIRYVESFLGKRVKCPRCNEVFKMPQVAAEPLIVAAQVVDEPPIAFGSPSIPVVDTSRQSDIGSQLRDHANRVPVWGWIVGGCCGITFLFLVGVLTCYDPPPPRKYKTIGPGDIGNARPYDSDEQYWRHETAKAKADLERMGLNPTDEEARAHARVKTIQELDRLEEKYPWLK